MGDNVGAWEKGEAMKWKKRVNRLFAIILTFALIASINVPALAWGEEAVEPTAEGVAAILHSDHSVRATCATLKEAIDGAMDGETVAMLNNVTIDAAEIKASDADEGAFYNYISGKSITLDLAGKTVTLDMSEIAIENHDNDERGVFRVNADGGLTIKDSGTGGTITALPPKAGSYSARPLIDNYGYFAFEGGMIKGVERVYYLVCTNGPSARVLIKGGTLDNQWGTSKDGGACLGANGKSSNAGFSIDITGGTLKGGEQTLYLPSAGVTTISGDSVLEGTARAVEIRAGELNIAGGTFSATESRRMDAVAGSGTTGAYTGALVVVNPLDAKETGYAGNISINVTGGTFENTAAVNGDALVFVNEQVGDGRLYDLNASISGGSFVGGSNVGNTVGFDKADKLSIVGGTFASDPSAYCAPGYRALDNGDGTFTVADAREAAIGDMKYATLAGAIADAGDGDTVTLLRDVAIDADTFPMGNNFFAYLMDKSITLDLAGKRVTLDLSAMSGNNAHKGLFQVHPGGGLTIRDSVGEGLITAIAPSDGSSVLRAFVDNHGTFKLESGTLKGVESVYYLVGTNGSGTHTIVSGGVLDNQWGTWEDGGVCLAANGQSANAGYQIDITGGVLKGGEQTLYLPSAGVTNVSGDAVLEGTARAIEIRSGELNIESGTFKASEQRHPEAAAGNGKTGKYTGALVAVNPLGANAEEYAGSIKIDVSGGIFENTSADGDAILFANEQEADPSYVMEASISGGRFIGGTGVDIVSGADKFFITGGTFSTDVSDHFDGDKYSQNALDAVDDPGAVVPRAYAVSYDLVGGTLQEGASNPVSYTYFDDDVVLANPSKVGYAFAGWTGTDLENAATNVTIAKNSTVDRSYVATWTPNANTAYAVEHYFQNVEGDGYTLDAAKTQSFSGTTDAETSAVALEVAGFTAKAVSQKMIAGDGSTVVEIRYDRNVHTLSYAYAGTVPDGASALPDARQLRYGAPVATAAQATAPGYTFGGWGVAEGYTMPDEDVELTGSFTANGDTAYRVEHYRQSLDGVYQLVAADELEGMTDSAVTAAPKTFTGFSYREDAPGSLASGAVKGDGSLVLKLFYDRNSYEVSYAYAGAVPVGAPAVPQTTSVAYGATVEPAAVPTMTGYTFSGWSKDVAFEMPAEKVVITGSWAANADVRYTVHYFLDGTDTKLADDKLVGERTFGQTYEEAALDIAGYTVKDSKVQQVTLDAYDKEATFFYTADEARIAFEANGGSRVDDLVGVTGAPVRGSLPAPTRVGYAFAGWYADKALTVPVTQLPAVFEAGATTYYAKWNAVPLPDADVEIQVELPQASGDGSAYAAVPDEAVRAAAEHAQESLESIGNGEVPAGMSAQDAQAVADVLEAAGSDDTVSVVISLRFEEKGASDVEEGEQQAIGSVVNDSEGVALYLDLGVEMTVKVVGDEGVKDQRTVSLNEVSTPLLFEIHVNPDLVKGKHVRIAHVHEGATEIIYPESVDREQGIVRFYASAFSTYALLTSDTVSVTFESNGGTAIEAQTLKLGEKASKPVDPKREGFAFGGWFSDEALTMAYDFAVPVDRSMTLYAKWTAISAGGGSGSGGDDAVVDDDGAKPSSKPLPQAQVPKKLVATGDGAGWLAASSIALVVLAAAAIVVAAKRRRSRG